MRGAERQLRELTQQLESARGLAIRRSEIEHAYAKFQLADEEERALAALFQGWRVASDEHHAAEAEIDRQRARMAADLEGLRQQMAELERQIASAADVQPDLEKARGRIAELEEIEARMPGVQAAVAESNEQLVGLRQDGERLKTEAEQVKQRIDLLGQNDRCPLCAQLLGADGLMAAQARLREELESVETRLAQAREAYTRQTTEVKAAQETVQQLQAKLTERPATERLVGELATRLAAADQQRRELAEERETEREAQRIFETEDFAHEARAAAERLQVRLETIGYDSARHQTARAARDALHTAPADMAALTAALTTLETADGIRAGLEAQRDAAAADTQALTAACANLETEAATLPRAVEALAAKEQELQQAGQLARTATRELGEARQMVAWLDQQEQEREGLVAQRAAVRVDGAAYDQLADAFGKNGIQEMIVEAALPEIEDTANELLARLTDGRMRVTLDTQRAGRGGATISTLDVNVSDELGTRPYELFSGGEKFRVDFSIRIAISKLLARRAGAPLQMLAIDEGFGTLDRWGCDRLIAAIKTIEKDFERILVITHMDEIKEAFPVRIEVEKTATGSTFSVN
jgi:exonuclease SbcC